jgi:hypothetical protein
LSLACSSLEISGLPFGSECSVTALTPKDDGILAVYVSQTPRASGCPEKRAAFAILPQIEETCHTLQSNGRVSTANANVLRFRAVSKVLALTRVMMREKKFS